MKEKSLVLIKPDAVERNLIGKIINIYEKNNLTISNLKMVYTSRDLAEKHYEEHSERNYFKELIDYITRSPVVALIIEGENAIQKIRKLNGNTDPLKADSGTIRKLYALNKNENSVHASDSITNANREISLWFHI